MAKRLNKLGYYLLGAIIISLILLAIFKFRSEGFTKPPINIYLKRNPAGGANSISLARGIEDANVKGVPSTSADTFTITMPATYRLQDYVVYGYTTKKKWEVGNYDVTGGITIKSSNKLIRPAGAKSLLATQIALPTATPTSSILVEGLGGIGSALQPGGDPAFGGANLRIELIM